ncbi:L-threonylcarbamoyladenylate synthase [Parvularcula marina]|uniref:L-threonylcarbamoyladenylate synthase n=1 Tax=Parvularcula marina TaxID=2292771 RepID=UPI00351160D7
MSYIWTASPDNVTRAADVLRAGGLIALPTETVYGLAADAANGEAVAQIYETKGRPRFNPLIVHVPDRAAAALIGEFSSTAVRLIEAFWPGALTLVMPLRTGAPVAPLVTAGLDTVAIRCPAHEVARAVLRAFDGPFVAPSANRSGRISPTTAGHVASEFGETVPVLDGGPCEIGLESTIVGLAGDRPTLLRPGAISSEVIEAVLGMKLATPGDGISAPGMMTSHYAPQAKVRLEAEDIREGEILLGFGGTKGAALDLSPSGNLREAAANLFAYLRQMDGMDKPIAVTPIPDEGLGAAINDRLKRAAAPRS